MTGDMAHFYYTYRWSFIRQWFLCVIIPLEIIFYQLLKRSCSPCFFPPLAFLSLFFFDCLCLQWRKTRRRVRDQGEILCLRWPIIRRCPAPKNRWLTAPTAPKRKRRKTKTREGRRRRSKKEGRRKTREKPRRACWKDLGTCSGKKFNVGGFFFYYSRKVVKLFSTCL